MYIHPRLLWVKSYANEGNVNKDVCKDLPIRNFSRAEKAEDPEDKFWYEICMIKVVVASKITSEHHSNFWYEI